MYKKLFAIITIITIAVFSFSIVLAADDDMLKDVTNDVRDAVGGAENTIENGARDISNTAKDMTNTNSGNNAGSENTNSYTATRTSSEGTSTFLGMGPTAWTWLIIGIAAIAIVALVWYYGTQINNTNINRD